MAKKILIATGIFPPDIGGPATYAKNLAEEFVKRGIGVAVITYGKEFKKDPRYSITGVSKKWPLGLRQLIYFGKILIAMKNSDAVLTLDSLGAGLPSVLAGKILKKKVIIRMGGDFLWERYVESGKGKVTMTEFYRQKLYRAYPLLHRLIMFTLRKADFIACTTGFQKNLLVQYCAIDPGKAGVIGNVLEKQAGEPAPYRENPRIILWAGRFIKLKNLDFLLKVFHKLLKQDDNLVLELIGDGPEKSHTEAQIQAMGLTAKVKISDGLNQKLLSEKINRSYLGVLPSLSDISPNFVLECLASNRAVIVTRETGIKDQFPGLIYADPRQEGEWLAAMSGLLDKKRHQEYQKAIAKIQYHKSWADLAKEYLRLLS